MKIKSHIYVLCFIAISLACNHLPKRAKYLQDNDLTMSDAITKDSLLPGREYPIQLPRKTNHPELHWYYEVDKNWVISVVENFEKSADTTKSSSDSSFFTVKALKPGNVILRFFLKSSSGNSGKEIEEKVYQLKVLSQNP